MTEKKVIFSAQDNISQKANQMYNNILSNAKKQSEVLKEQTGYINAQIKALEQKQKLEAKSGNRTIQEQQLLYRHASTRAEQSKYQQRIEAVQKDLGESTAVLEVLKGLLQENRKQTVNAEKLEKQRQKHTLSSEDQYQAMKSLARQEVRENISGVRQKIRQAEKTDYAGLDPRTAEKLMFQKSLVGGEKGGSSGVFTATFAGVLAAGLIQQVAAVMGRIVGSQSGEQAFNSLLGTVPVFGGFLGSGAERSFQEQLDIQNRELGLQAKTGRPLKGLSNQTKMGFSTKESLDMMSSLVGAAGGAGGANQTQNGLLLQRGLGLSPEIIAQIVKDIRTTRSSADMIQIVSDVLRVNPELRKDQTKFTEILSQTSQLTNQLAQQTEYTNMRANIGVVGALRSIGGSFADPNLGPQRMLAINQSLTAPGTEYQKARSFGVLSGLQPGMSYFQMLEAQEQGIGKKGYLGGVLKQLQRETGGGENLMLAVNQNLGLGASTSRRLVEAFKKNPKMFDSFAGGAGDIEQVLGLTKRAETVTAQRDKEKAEIDNAFAISAAAGDMKVASLTLKAAADTFSKAMDKITPSSAVIQKLGNVNANQADAIRSASNPFFGLFNSFNNGIAEQ